MLSCQTPVAASRVMDSVVVRVSEDAPIGVVSTSWTFCAVGAQTLKLVLPLATTAPRSGTS